jgi:UDP-N-acetylmuramyl pentapeptide phosphotransferase/UDP-N-acetylglucosamine-1-phosphate transferase
MELDEIKTIWNDMNARLEKTEAMNAKLLEEVINNRHQTSKDKLMKYEVKYLILSTVFAILSPFYYYTEVFSTPACAMFTSLFVITALWQWYKIRLMKNMKIETSSTSELLQKAIKFKVITRMRTIIGLALMIPFFAIMFWVSPGLIKLPILIGMGVGAVIGLIIGLVDYFRNQKDIDSLINCYRDIQELR